MSQFLVGHWEELHFHEQASASFQKLTGDFAKKLRMEGKTMFRRRNFGMCLSNFPAFQPIYFTSAKR